jgi:hypothetical protein
MQEQITSNVFMIRPVSFSYNEETAFSNTFQQEKTISAEQINAIAKQSFDDFVNQLKLRGINVFVFNDTIENDTPDSVFPNNWVSLHHSGKAILYPMEAKNRRLERRTDILDFLKTKFDLNQVIDLSYFEAQNKFLEGTGSLVLDRINRIAYACLSSRTNKEVINEWEKQMKGYETVVFQASDVNGHPIYHTNVLMCMGDTFCIICLNAIADIDQRFYVKKIIETTRKEVIEISLDQMQNFAGNMLLLKTKNDKKLLVMSVRALKSLNSSQKKLLEEKAEILAVDIDIIETLGGGSARCMIAEIHLSEK